MLLICHEDPFKGCYPGPCGLLRLLRAPPRRDFGPPVNILYPLQASIRDFKARQNTLQGPSRLETARQGSEGPGQRRVVKNQASSGFLLSLMSLGMLGQQEHRQARMCIFDRTSLSESLFPASSKGNRGQFIFKRARKDTKNMLHTRSSMIQYPCVFVFVGSFRCRLLRWQIVYIALDVW